MASSADLITELQLKALSPSDVKTRLREKGNLLGKVRSSRGRIIVAFEYRYRSTDRTRSIAVGTWPDDSLRAIRKQRDAYRIEIEQGRDPLAAKAATELAVKADQAEAISRDQARLDAVAAAACRMTINELFNRWEKLALKSRKDGGAEVRRMFEKDVLPEIGTMAVEDVKRRHVAAMLDKTKERGVGRMVNLMLSLTRQMFRFAVSRDWIEADPTALLKKADFGGKEVERDRTLSESEVQELRDKLPLARLKKATEVAIWVMLSTCCRVGELSMSEWADIDLTNRRWRIPQANAKNGHEHVIALSDFSAKQFELLKTVQASPVWVFPDRTGNKHIDEKSFAKQVHDRQRTVPMKGRSNKVATMLLAGGEWTPHDLRRTGSTIMGELGVNENVIDRCLNHVEPNRMKRIYQRQKYEYAKAEAWRLLGERIELLMRTDTDNVVSMTSLKNFSAT